MPDDESSRSDEETALTSKSSAALQRLNTHLEATERALAHTEDRYVQFFRENTEFFVRLVSRWHPIDPELLEQYSDRWHWKMKGDLTLNAV